MLANNKNKTSFRVSIHALIWLVLLLFPYFLSSNDTIDLVRQIKFTWIPMCFYAVLFYLNYLVLIDKVLFKQKYLFFISVNLILILIFTWIHVELKDLLNLMYDMKNVVGPKFTPQPTSLFVYKDIISMLIPIIISFAVKTTEKWAKAESEKKENEKEVLKSELQHLKYQLQPHFFFNSLNTIYALIERSPALAQETVHDLSKLMRYLLYDTEVGKAKLRDEIEFMKQYINLMKLRTSDKTIVQANFPMVSERHFITPLLFISLIENAFKHGVSSTQNSEILFNLQVEGKKVSFFAENKNFPKNDNDKSGSGIGMNNLKKQLDISYPGKHTFKTKVENGLFKVMLEVYTD